jgi:hypothetical protein
MTANNKILRIPPAGHTICCTESNHGKPKIVTFFRTVERHSRSCVQQRCQISSLRQTSRLFGLTDERSTSNAERPMSKTVAFEVGYWTLRVRRFRFQGRVAESGLRHSTRNRAWGNPPWVRIPPLPPASLFSASTSLARFCASRIGRIRTSFDWWGALPAGASRSNKYPLGLWPLDFRRDQKARVQNPKPTSLADQSNTKCRHEASDS